MFSAADLPDTLPIFPLPGAIILPRARLPLQIFEPRYLAMLDDVLKTPHRLIGMIQPTDSDDRPNLCAIGCAGRITGFSETGNGRYAITLTGISRFRVDEEEESFTPYRRARVLWKEFDDDPGSAETDPDFDRKEFLALLRRYLQSRGLSTDWDNLKDAGDELLINSLSMMCPFANEDKQALLESPSLSARRETIVTLMEFALRGGGADEVMQ